ncbi:MAG: hypothetical protein GC152_08700 [Alphaproteobacteria bacterium]|nr:hypothetical protein [Alphaproteobacteria bacterium]
MPLIEVRVAAKQLSDSIKYRIATELSKAFVEHLGVSSANATAVSITRVEFVEFAVGDVFQGSKLATGVVRISFFVPGGAMSDSARASLAEAADRILAQHQNLSPLSAEGQSRWCMFFDMPDGSWASNGAVYDWRAIKRYVARDEFARRRAGRAPPA